jgi:RNA methyltransferase, TrmH family
VITSTDNQLIKMVSSLHHKKGRQEHHLFLAEGCHLVQEALRAGANITRYFWTGKWASTEEGAVLLKILQDKYEGFELSEPVFNKISETQTPQGVIAVIAIPHPPDLELAEVKLGLILDGLQDPGNVGTIIRTAWAGNLDCLLLTPGTADPYQGKVIRASMGGIFQQKIYQNLAPQFIAALAARKGLQIVAGDQRVSESYFECDFRSPTLILIGSEGRGLEEEWENFSVKKASIPQPGAAESLNAAVSAGILIYEALRQRTLKDTCKN